MFVRRIFLLMAYFLAFVAFAATKTHYSQKNQGIPFQTSMRYGRSGRAAVNAEQRSGSKYPRAETFYLGPRYGKRSSDQMKAGVAYSPASPICVENENLSCVYTGLSNMYRCGIRKYGLIKDIPSSQ